MTEDKKNDVEAIARITSYPSKTTYISTNYTQKELMDIAENEQLSPIYAEVNFNIILGKMFKTLHTIDKACNDFYETMNHDFVKIFYTPNNSESSVIKFNSEKRLIEEIYHIRNRIEKLKAEEQND